MVTRGTGSSLKPCNGRLGLHLSSVNAGPNGEEAYVWPVADASDAGIPLTLPIPLAST
jgi:hypothetical protein